VLSDRVLGADLAWSTAFVLLTLVMLGGQRCGTMQDPAVLGETAAEDIRAPFDLEVVDRARTEEMRRAARDAVPDVYLFDGDRGERLAAALGEMFEEGRAAKEEGVEPDVASLPERTREATAAALAAVEWSEDVEQALCAAIGRTMRSPIVGNRALLWTEPSVLMVSIPSGTETVLDDYERVRDLDEARSRVRSDVARALDVRPDVEQVLADLAAAFVDANLSYDPEGTRTRRERAASEVPPVRERIPRGTLIVAAGETVDDRAAAAIAATHRGRLGRLDPPHVLGSALLVAALAFFLYRYATYHQRAFRRLQHLHALLVLVQLSMLMLAAGILWVVHEVVVGLPGPIGDVDRYVPLVPIGAGAVLVALLANGRIGIAHSAFAAVLYGALDDWSLYTAFWALVVQWAGVYAVTSYRDRSALLRAGLVVGAAGAGAYVAVEAVRSGFGDPYGALYGAAVAFVGGTIGAGLVVSFTLPLLEGLFHVLTEIRLLELSNLDNPLISQLAVKAPGSYNHSLVVGTLAEEGAKAIGANALFCRVAAIYHDIGKMLKPEYFVENQRGSNPHDRLAPSMSALIISSHVKDGIRIARDAGVPEQIVDIIPQHHGTRLMTYFHEKAKGANDPSHGSVEESDFRYPGPKPQTREAAIFMLSDAVEAAARTVDDPTPNRLREMIRRVTNAIVLDGQFDECDLTFADLDRLQSAFLRTLVSMHHHRVDYPGFEFNRPATIADPAGPA